MNNPMRSAILTFAIFVAAVVATRRALACPTGFTCCTNSTACIAEENDTANATVLLAQQAGGNSSAAVSGNILSGAGVGVYGSALSGIGVFGQNSMSGNATGVMGQGGASRPGVMGCAGSVSCTAPSFDYGVFGVANDTDAIHGNSSSSGHAGVSGVNTNGGYGVYGQSSTGTAIYATSSSGYAAQLEGLVSVVGDVDVTGTLTATSCCASDARLKKNVKPIVNGLDQLLRLKGVTYEWIDPSKHGDATGSQTGFIAQDVEKVYPEWVHHDHDGFLTLEYRQTEALEVEAIREVNAKYEALQAKYEALQAEYEAKDKIIQTQDERITRLEKLAGVTQVSWYERNQGLLTALMGLGLLGGFAGYQRIASRRRREHEERS